LADSTGAKIAWIPRRAGERGAIEAGAIGNLLPGGRPVADAAARVDIAALWGTSTLPSQIGRSSDEILAAVNSGAIGALLVGGVDPLDGINSKAALAALDAAFVVCLEIAPSEVTMRADVVLPVAAITEKSGSFLNWEGRARSFDAAVHDSLNRSDLRILSMVAEEMGAPLKLSTVSAAAKEIASLGVWEGARASMKAVSAEKAPTLSGDQFILNSWRRLLDLGTLQKGEENLAGTARQTIAVISPKRAQAMGVADGDLLKISSALGSVTLPALVEDIHDDAVWAPRNSRGSQLLINLGVGHGAVVTVVKL
jgi:NADH-quinone oxidoreductase subunit G